MKHNGKMLGVETKERRVATMNQLNIAWRRMLISTYNHFSFLPFASFFLCIGQVLLEDAATRFIDLLPSLSLSLSSMKKFKKKNYVIRDESVRIYISSKVFEIPTFDTNLPVSLVSLAIKLHRSKKPSSLHLPPNFQIERTYDKM